MRQLCVPSQASKDSAFIVLADGEHLRDKVLAALPSPLDIDASELATSSLLARALKQVIRLVQELVDRPDRLHDAICTPSLAHSLQVEKTIRGSGGLDVDTAQVVLAAEYARRFVCELCQVPGTGEIVAPCARPQQELLAWDVISNCAATAYELRVDEDSYTLLFRDGWEALRQRTHEPLVSSAFIAECQSCVHACLATEASSRAAEKRQTAPVAVSTVDKAARRQSIRGGAGARPTEMGESGTAADTMDPAYFRLVHMDAILDFPQVQLVECCGDEEE